MTHKCKMTNDEDNLRHNKNLAEKFTAKCNQDFSAKNVGNHRNWADKKIVESRTLVFILYTYH